MAVGNGSSILEFFNDGELIDRLRHCTQLPSPPGVAARIIELGQDPEATTADVVDAVSIDPALSLKLVRLANAPIYARRRKTENLRQAIMMFGVNGTLTIALSFSLVGNLRDDKKSRMNYSLFWRRSLAVASCNRVLGFHLRLGSREDLFLAGLLQDIGMLALDKALPEVYEDLGDGQRNHAHTIQHERGKLNTDHAAIGAWLLNHWNVPERLVFAAAGSHDPSVMASHPDHEAQSKCIVLANAAASIFTEQDTEAATREVARLANEYFEMDEETLSSLLDAVREDLQESARLFDIRIGNSQVMEALLEEAKEILTIRNLTTMQEAAELQKTTINLENRTKELEEANRRDGLTGLFNRAFLDEKLVEGFEPARKHGWPFSVAFVDLDHFKLINDQYGHQAGDQILQTAAKLLLDAIRDADYAVRYGGEEFVLILPGTNVEGACVIADRLLRLFRDFRHQVSGSDKEIELTVSVGIATFDDQHQFATANKLLKAADDSVYRAKRQGRNQCVVYSAESENAITDTPTTTPLSPSHSA